MDEHVTNKVNRVKNLSAQLNSAIIDLTEAPGGRDIKVEIDVLPQMILGRLYAVPLLQVKLSEVKTL